jgi:hypothetical protein
LGYTYLLGLMIFLASCWSINSTGPIFGFFWFYGNENAVYNWEDTFEPKNFCV